MEKGAYYRLNSGEVINTNGRGIVGETCAVAPHRRCYWIRDRKIARATSYALAHGYKYICRISYYSPIARGRIITYDCVNKPIHHLTSGYFKSVYEQIQT
jgi:hypothetical protein